MQTSFWFRKEAQGLTVWVEGEVSFWGLVSSSGSMSESFAGMGWGERQFCSGVSLHLQPLPWSHNKRRWPETEMCSEFIKLTNEKKKFKISWDTDCEEIYHSLLEKWVPITIARNPATEQYFRGDTPLLAPFSSSMSKGPNDLSSVSCWGPRDHTAWSVARLSFPGCDLKGWILSLKIGNIKPYICLCAKALLEMPK